MSGQTEDLPIQKLPWQLHPEPLPIAERVYAPDRGRMFRALSRLLAYRAQGRPAVEPPAPDAPAPAPDAANNEARQPSDLTTAAL
jgi:hypothetical protein